MEELHGKKGENLKIGIIGYKGFLGSAIYSYFWTKYPYGVMGISKDNYAETPKEFDILINANGSPLKRLADTDPRADFEMNVKSVMDTLSEFKFRKYVYISSVEVYGDHEDQDRNAEEVEPDEKLTCNYGFNKHLAEKLVKRYAKSSLIFRLGRMVGPGLKKNIVYDIVHTGKTFVSPLSKYQFIDTPSVAKTMDDMLGQGIENETFNLCGDGLVSGEEIADMAGKQLDMALYEQPREAFNINISKVCRFVTVPQSRDSVRKYVSFTKSGTWGED
jgi:nucleoside-diphosphate-sugar epimerase